MWKRIIDVFLASLLLVLLAPVLVAIALIVRSTSPGPVLFKQVRVGRHGRRFKLWKFRSMYEGSVGALVTAAGDSRVTRVGSWLRKYKLDELPQLWNVIKGEMSLVGPRPEVPEFVEYYPPSSADKIFSVRPGITDLASIEYRYESEMLQSAEDPRRCYLETILPRKIAYYERYADSHSLRGDLRIVLMTIRAIFRGRSAGGGK